MSTQKYTVNACPMSCYPKSFSPLKHNVFVLSQIWLAQGPTGSWWTPPAAVSSSLTSADEAMNSSSFYATLLNVLALAACVLGPYMAITGLR